MKARKGAEKKKTQCKQLKISDGLCLQPLPWGLLAKKHLEQVTEKVKNCPEGTAVNDMTSCTQVKSEQCGRKEKKLWKI